MRATLFIAALAAAFLVSGPAIAQKVRLRAQITPTCNSSGSALKFADIFAEGNIAVQGSYLCRGAFIYNISNPDSPFLASWYNPGNNQQFLEAIVVGNRGYFGSGNGGGVHIVDLTDPANPQLLGIVSSSNGGGLDSIHEMVVWGNFLIENANTFGNKIIKVINISNPTAPVFVRDITPTEPLWVHAMHIRGNRMFTSGWGTSTQRGRTEIYDITNLGTQAPTLLGFVEDPSPNVTAGNNMHSSWTSEDGNFLYSARETNNGTGDLRVYNISNPAVPLLVRTVTMGELGLNAVTPHNPVVMGNYLYVSWYQAGVQVFDITNPAVPQRVGQYDTFQAAFAPSAEEKAALENAQPWDMICSSEFRQNALPTTYDGNWAVFPFLGTNKVLAGDLTSGLLVLDVSSAGDLLRNRVSDFDGDRKTDLSIFHPSTGQWLIESSSSGALSSYFWGIPGDQMITGDYDGDGRADLGVWRSSNGTWYQLRSGSSYFVVPFGEAGDIPVPADYDADGRTDLAVWRPSNGLWYIQSSSLGYRVRGWGVPGDKALSGDFEGDGKADLVIWRPSNGNWYVVPSSSSIPIQVGWGVAGDKPVYADFNGDGRAEFTIFRPSEGRWYTLDIFNGSITTQQFGEANDIPLPADFDGDGKTDIAIFRPSDNTWHWLGSAAPGYHVRQFGPANGQPSPMSVQPQ